MSRSSIADAPSTKGALSQSRQKLVELMQLICFGRIARLVVRGGEPVLDPAPLVLRTVKLSGSPSNSPRAEMALTNFALKQEIRELFTQLDQLGDGAIEKIEIAHGLPQLMVIAQTAPAA